MSKEKILAERIEIFPSDEVMVDEDIKHNVYAAMDKYAKEQAIAFAEWKIANRWFTYEDGYWHYTFEPGTAMSEKSYNKNYRKTTEQLYAQFIESQSSHQQ